MTLSPRFILTWALLGGVATVYAGQLLFDGVPVDITSATNEDVVIAPGEGGNTQIGDKSGTNTNATANDDLWITGALEVDGASYLDGVLTVGGAATVTGATTLNGAVTLGDATSDDVTLTGRLASSAIPKTDSSYDLGSSSLAWGNLYVDAINSVTGNDLSFAPVSGQGLAAAVTRSASTGDEALYSLSGTVNKATSGNYTGLKLNVTETAAPGSADKLLDLQVGGTSWLQAFNGANSANYGALSLGSGKWDGSTTGYFAGSSSGTLLAGNAASGFAGNLLDLQVAGTSLFKVDASGNVTQAGTTTQSGNIDMGNNLILNIGNASTDFTSTGGLTLAGALAANGNTTLGDASGDTVTANAAAWTLANDTAVTLSGGTDGINFDANTLSIDAANDRVGIGTASPDQKLVVGGSGASRIKIVAPTAQTALWFSNSNNAAPDRWAWYGWADLPISSFRLWNTNLSADSILFSNDGTVAIAPTVGNVGIGTTSPQGKAHIWQSTSGTTPYTGGGTPGLVVEASANTTLQFLTGANSDTRIWFGDAGNTTSGGIVYTHNATTVNEDLRIDVGNGQRMAILGSGNVGIGTTGPQHLLHVQGTSAGSILNVAQFRNSGSTAGTGAGIVLTTHTDGAYGARIAAVNEVSTPSFQNAALTFWTMADESGLANLDERMRISASGNVGIGTASPAARLDVANTGTAPYTTTGLAVASTFSPSAGGTQSNLTLATTNAATTAANTTRGLAITVTDAGTLANTNVALSLNAATANANDTQRDLYFPGTSPTIDLANTGTLTFRDDAGNTLLSLADAGTTGNLTVTGTVTETGNKTITGNLSVNGNTTLGDASTDTVTLNANALTLANATTLDLANTQTSALNIEAGLLNLDTTNSRVGIGTTGPDGKLHVFSGSAGTVTASTDADDVTVENSGNAGLSILAPDASVASVYFGNPTSNLGALFEWDFTSNQLTLATNKANAFLSLRAGVNSEKVRIQSNGNVGIGTAGPLSKLDVRGESIITSSDASANARVVYIRHDGTIGQVRSDFYGTGTYSPLTFWTSGAEKVRIDTTGNVGIGTTDPSTGPLRVAVAAAKTAVTTTNAAFLGTNEAVASNPFGVNIAVTGAAAIADRYVKFETTDYNLVAGGNLVFNPSGGNVGIGTTGPVQRLHVSGGALRIDGALVAAGAGGLTLSTEVGYKKIQSYDSTPLSINPDGNNVGIGYTDPGTAKLAISGNVGIGTTNPSSKLSVERTDANEDNIASFTNTPGYGVTMRSSSGKYTLAIVNADGNGNNHVFYGSGGHVGLALTSGNVGIGTATPAAKLHALATTEQLRLDYNGSNLTSFTQDGNGDLTVDTTRYMYLPNPTRIGSGGDLSIAQLAIGGTSAANIESAISISQTVNPAANRDAEGLSVGVAIQEAATGTHAMLSGVSISAPAITAGAATVADAATLYIVGAPSATVTGANHALWVDDGLTRLDGALTLTPAASAPVSPTSGMMYMDSTPAPDELCVYDGTGWQALITGTDANCA